MPNICLSVTRYTAPVARRERLAISPVHSVVTLNKTSAAKAAGAEHPRRPEQRKRCPPGDDLVPVEPRPGACDEDEKQHRQAERDGGLQERCGDFGGGEYVLQVPGGSSVSCWYCPPWPGRERRADSPPASGPPWKASGDRDP